MAEERDIQEVKDLLPVDSGASGWDSARISSDLDAGLTKNRIALQFWSNRAANTFTLTSVSESGSSRTLTDIHRNAVAMQKLYQDLVNKEDEVVDPGEPGGTPTRGPGIYTHPIRRMAREA